MDKGDFQIVLLAVNIVNWDLSSKGLFHSFVQPIVV